MLCLESVLLWGIFQEFDEYQLAKYCSEGNRKRTLMKRAKTSRYFAAMVNTLKCCFLETLMSLICSF